MITEVIVVVILQDPTIDNHPIPVITVTAPTTTPIDIITHVLL